jgi:hypothetical protein
MLFYNTMIVKYTTHLDVVYETKKISWQAKTHTRSRKPMTNFVMSMTINEPRGRTRDVSAATINGTIIQMRNREAGARQRELLRASAPTGRR